MVKLKNFLEKIEKNKKNTNRDNQEDFPFIPHARAGRIDSIYVEGMRGIKGSASECRWMHSAPMKKFRKREIAKLHIKMSVHK